MASTSSLLYSFSLCLIFLPNLIKSQQPYAESNCPTDNTTSSILGYSCNGVNRTCDTFLIYRSQPLYNTIPSIASLLSADPSQMSKINNVSENIALETNKEVIVPVTCSCTGHFSQVNTTYTVKDGEYYQLIANNTFEGLSTCQAIQTQKISPEIQDIFPNEILTIPLRCACPTKTQVDEGIGYLLSYVILPGQYISKIATSLGADVGQTLEANEKSEKDSLIQPFTTLLVPLRDSNIKTSPSPRPNPSPLPSSGPRRSSNVVVAVSVPIVIVIFLVIIGASICIYRCCKSAKHSSDLEEFFDIESLKFEFQAIRDATNNFSHHNKLGQGGFGGVYKGKLQNGQQIAVKRLSLDSGQGDEEFKTEVLLVAKLQHNNLVKLLGFCLHGDEKLLVYELLPNASLDKVLLDRNRKPSLDWESRYKILLGTARGLLYLHEDSRLKIIHRDLKLSNILLDEDMNPKIGDFGLARLVGKDQFEAQTSRIAGTYGYMAPEYIFGGRFSIMSDVYSFGVIALEIVTGHACFSTIFQYENETVCSRAWKLWKNEAIFDLVDSRLDGNYIGEEVKRCIHIGLLCIQEDANKRPMMGLIISALNGHPVILPDPEAPFFGPPKLNQYSSELEGLTSSIEVSKVENDSREIFLGYERV